MLLDALAVAGGLALLTKASDELVKGAARIALTLRISAVVVGAVVIGFGTSAPELLVSGLAAGRGLVDISIGNIVGSNLANLTLILGVAALVRSIRVTSLTLIREAPLSAAAVVLFAFFLQTELKTLEGVVLLGALVITISGLLRFAHAGEDELTRGVEEFAGKTLTHPLRVEIPRTVLGLAGTLAGAHLLVSGASGIARELGIAEGFIGLTLVALGTSLPELVTSIQAARRNEVDLIVGNLLGSNIFNSLAVGGVVALLGVGHAADETIGGLGALLMSAAALTTWLLMATGKRVSRREGALLVAAYLVILPLLAT